MYRLVVVDDEPFIIEGLKHIIDWEEYGIELIGTASNGVEALEIISKSETDILITDIKMPKMNGLELIQNVKRIAPCTRFLILSGYDDFEYLKESIKLGIENYILKPINCEELEESIINVRNKIEAQILQKTYSNEDTDIIRNNILYRWVTGCINQMELVERAAFLGIPLEASKYVVCILRLLTNTTMEQTVFMHKAQEVFSELKSYNQGLIFCTPENNIVFIMSELEEAFKLAEHCISNLKKTFNVKFFFTIGNEENEYSLVSRSYFNAMELQQYSIVMPCGSVLEYNNFIKNRLGNHTEETVSYNEVTKYVLSKDLNSLTAYIDVFFMGLKKSYAIDPNIIKNTAAELLFCIINSFRQAIEIKTNMINELGYPFYNIYKIHTLDEMAEFVKDTTKKLIDLSRKKTESINPTIKRTLDYMKINYSKDISLKVLAVDLNTNPNYLGQLFKEETNEYFSDYLNIMRINKAKELLKSTERSTKQISNTIGYRDVNYFYKTFKKYCGVSPSEFRSSSFW